MNRPVLKLTRRKRNALNRGTAVHLGGSRVQFIWPCGCVKEETVHSPAGALPPDAVRKLVTHWRDCGVTLPQCRNHPNFYSPLNQVPRLNRAYPQPETPS